MDYQTMLIKMGELEGAALVADMPGTVNAIKLARRIAALERGPGIKRETRRCYVVQPGDTLSDIALSLFGNGDRYEELWRLNSNRLRGKTPSEIYPGEVILLPE